MINSDLRQSLERIKNLVERPAYFIDRSRAIFFSIFDGRCLTFAAGMIAVGSTLAATALAASFV